MVIDSEKTSTFNLFSSRYIDDSVALRVQSAILNILPSKLLNFMLELHTSKTKLNEISETTEKKDRLKHWKETRRVFQLVWLLQFWIQTHDTEFIFLVYADSRCPKAKLRGTSISRSSLTEKYFLRRHNN